MKFLPRPLVKTRDNSRGKPRLKDWVKGLASVAIFLGVAYMALGWIADGIASSISEESEAELFQWLDIGDQPTNNLAFNEAQRIFEELLEDPQLRPLPYHLVLLDLGDPNAFALPGGLVGVTPGLLEIIDSEIGMAFVLAHELGHQQHRHALKRLGRALIHRIAIGWISGSGDLSLLNHALSLATLKHSRDQERDADDFGLALIHRVHGTTEGAFEFFEHIHNQAGDGSKIGAMFQTHPLTEERLRDLHEAATHLRGSIERL